MNIVRRRRRCGCSWRGPIGSIAADARSSEARERSRSANRQAVAIGCDSLRSVAYVSLPVDQRRADAEGWDCGQKILF